MKNWLKKALSLFSKPVQEIDPKKVDAWPFPIAVEKKPKVAKATTRKAKVATEKPAVKKAKKTVKKAK